MPYSPTIQTLNLRAIADNLLGYFASTQSDALTWSGTALSVTGLTTVAKFSASAASRELPVFPAMMFVDDNDAVEHGEDMLTGVYTCTLELMIQNADPDTVVSKAKAYAKAFVSMIANCPKSTLEANTGCVAGTSQLRLMETSFEPIKTNELHNDFLQVVQIKPTFSVVAGAYV
jgi:hypothetical protein